MNANFKKVLAKLKKMESESDATSKTYEEIDAWKAKHRKLLADLFAAAGFEITPDPWSQMGFNARFMGGTDALAVFKDSRSCPKRPWFVAFATGDYPYATFKTPEAAIERAMQVAARPEGSEKTCRPI